MTTTLADHQFEILPNRWASEGFVFGIGAEVSVDDNGFDPGDIEWLTQDTQNTRRGSRAFGRDVRGAKTWTWSSHVNRTSEEEALDTLDRFSAAWSPADMALTPGEVTVLRYQTGGRARRVYGRPRRFSAPPSNLILGGYVPVTHDFECVDSFTYDDAISTVLIPYSTPAPPGGFVLPISIPFPTASRQGNAEEQIVVGGNTRAYPAVRFNGPWTNPSIDTGAWTLSWNGTIPEGGWVEIDCRPWRLTTLWKSGASAVAGLPARTWLEDCWFAPGDRPILKLGGFNANGNTSALVGWRNTWTSI